jgi:hypothetical protein
MHLSDVSLLVNVRLVRFAPFSEISLLKNRLISKLHARDQDRCLTELWCSILIRIQQARHGTSAGQPQAATAALFIRHKIQSMTYSIFC